MKDRAGGGQKKRKQRWENSGKEVESKAVVVVEMNGGV